MRVVKNILSQLHVYVLWLLLSTVFWGWIFSAFVTDARPEKKVVVYVDAVQCADRELALRLEEDMPGGLRMIQVHPFSYAMFDRDALLQADLFIVPASEAEEYAGFFAPLTDAVPAGYGEPRRFGGTDYGVMIRDGAGHGAAAAYIGYADGEEYYLFFGAQGVHAATLTGKGDDAALSVARTLLALREDTP